VKTRYSERKKATCKVSLSCGARVGEGHLIDLTVPGCRLETTLALELGQCVQLRVQLERQRPMRIDLGIVRWVKGTIAAIEFIRMTQDDQIRLRRYLGYVEKRQQPSSTWSEAPMCVGF
jgi:hypothetical protein